MRRTDMAVDNNYKEKIKNLSKRIDDLSDAL